jgi:hypothetical protein
MYRTVKLFTERFDENHTYNPGDIYPREGFDVPDGRAEALCERKITELNRMGQIFLKYETNDPEDADTEPAEPKKPRKPKGA